MNLMKKLQSVLEIEIKIREYKLGELIIPQKFIKTTLCGNRIEDEKEEISGRNICKNSCEKDPMEYLITWTGKVLLRTYKSLVRFKVVV